MGLKEKGRETWVGWVVPNLFPREKLPFEFLELQWVA